MTIEAYSKLPHVILHVRGELASKLLLKVLIGQLEHAGGRCSHTDGINLHGGGRLRWFGGKRGVGEALLDDGYVVQGSVVSHVSGAYG